MSSCVFRAACNQDLVLAIPIMAHSHRYIFPFSIGVSLSIISIPLYCMCYECTDVYEQEDCPQDYERRLGPLPRSVMWSLSRVPHTVLPEGLYPEEYEEVPFVGEQMRYDGGGDEGVVSPAASWTRGCLQGDGHGDARRTLPSSLFPASRGCCQSIGQFICCKPKQKGGG